MTLDQFIIEEIDQYTESAVRDLIRRNLEGYEEAGAVIASTFRRLERLLEVYQSPGAKYFVLMDQGLPRVGEPNSAPTLQVNRFVPGSYDHTSSEPRCVGGAGIGSLHGLPVTEGLGEVRDLVLDSDYRGRGLGARLLKRCVEEAKAMGFRSLYLETTPKMENAQKLFMRFGFRPVTEFTRSSSYDAKASASVPSYFILEKLASTGI